jgi:tetratricopeptide (TPR) repeat protein
MGDTAKTLPLLGAVIVLLALCGFLFASLTGAFEKNSWWARIASVRTPEEDPDFLWERAQKYYKQGNREWAGITARRISYLAPRHKDSRKLLAALALQDKDYATARRYCGEVLGIDPSDRSAMIGLGNALKGLKQYEQARVTFEKVLNFPYSLPAEKEEATIALADLQPLLKKSGKSSAKKPTAPATGTPPPMLPPLNLPDLVVR